MPDHDPRLFAEVELRLLAGVLGFRVHELEGHGPALVGETFLEEADLPGGLRIVELDRGGRAVPAIVLA